MPASRNGNLTYVSISRCLPIAGEVATGEKITEIAVETATFTVAWHPKQYLLAFACDDKDPYDRKRDAGTLKVFGFPKE